MAIIFVDVYGRCDLPIGNCSDVVLCMTSEWADRTNIGLAIAFGRIVATNQTYLNRTPSAAYQPCCTAPATPVGCEPPTPTPTNPCCPSYTLPQANPCAPTPPPTNPCLPPSCNNGYLICVYQIEIDTEQFLIDPETETNYVPICSDFLDISPYPCLWTQIIAALSPAYIDGDTIDFTFSPLPTNELTAEVILDPAVENILTASASGLLAQIYSDNTIDGAGTQADPLTVPPSADADNILTLGSDGQLYVPPDAAAVPNSATDTASVDITLSGTFNRDIQADVNLSANANQAITEEVDGLHVEQSYADTENDAITGDAGALAIDAAATYTIATSGIITVNNPSTNRDLAFKLDGDTNVQCTLLAVGVWKIIIQQNINGGGFADYAEKQYGVFPGTTGLPLDISAGYETTIPAGGSLTIQRRIQIQTITPSGVGSVAGVYSSDMRAIWVTK